MLLTFVLSVPMALLWIVFSRQLSFEGFIVGYIFGFAILTVIRLNTTFDDRSESLKLWRIPFQVFALIVYILQLSLDVFLSGLDVAGKVLNPKMPINPGIHTISTQDKSNSDLISALSAHSITITPGELVIDYQEDSDGQTLMLVHTLDKEASSKEKLEHEQSERLSLIRRILGKDSTDEGEA
ncbi:MAG: Na+/H+ antiporter subunit E [Phototrophicaceae bacterium]